LISISASPNKFEGTGGLESLEDIGGCTEVDLDSRSLAEVLDFVAGDLDQAAEEELGRSEVGIGPKISFCHDAGEGAAALATLRGLVEGGDGEGIFHEARLTVPDPKYYNITSFML